ncbi:ELWxxDGT repeat protein [Winogradskyella sp. A2]|uniref:ELWxxDGT repeat protein n=1 Tax=Winogradskyella sp. A2 TaxID=3366944 RepID=UPI00398C5963
MKKNLLFFAVFFSVVFGFAQVTLVRDIMSGAPNGININTELFKYNNKILFKSFAGELSYSDGTNSGTFWINIGIGRAEPEGFTLNSVTNEVYFSARGPGVNDTTVTELWKTDGTAVGTMLVHDFSPFTGWSSRPTDICDNSGIIFCNAYVNSTGNELCISDPINTSNNTISIDPTASGSNPEHLFAFNGNVYFSASGPAGYRELYVSDGTYSGTGLLKNLNPVGFGDPEEFVEFNNKLYFTAKNGSSGRELWVTDGTSAGTYMVADINPGGHSNPSNFHAVGNRLYFSATNDSTGTELYYMLTNESVILYRDINPGTASSNPSGFTSYNGYTYFNADDGTNGQELWRTNGSIFGIGLFKDLNPNGSSSPVSFKKYNGNLYFSADDGTNGEELWITDGTSVGTVMIADINPGAGSSAPRFLVDVDGELLFHADDGSVGRELWKYVDPALSTDDVELSSEIKLLPNPSQDYFSISTQLNIEDVLVYDINGKLVKQFYGLQDQYKIEDLSTGLYLVNVYSEDKKETLKLMKL